MSLRYVEDITFRSLETMQIWFLKSLHKSKGCNINAPELIEEFMHKHFQKMEIFRQSSIPYNSAVCMHVR